MYSRALGREREKNVPQETAEMYLQSVIPKAVSKKRDKDHGQTPLINRISEGGDLCICSDGRLHLPVCMRIE
jgi:hypothetical protein